MIISNIYKRAFNVLSKMPFKLWGLSLLSSLSVSYTHLTLPTNSLV